MLLKKVTEAIIVAACVVIIAVTGQVSAIQSFRGQSGASGDHNGARLATRGTLTNELNILALELGVVHVNLYVRVPADVNGGSVNKTALLHVWLKRGGLPPRDMENEFGAPRLRWQVEPSVAGFAWLEDLDRLDESFVGHLKMHLPKSAWRPKLWLVTAAGGLLAAEPEPGTSGPAGLSNFFDIPTRPHDFTFRLQPRDAAAGHCFKLYDASTPSYQVPVCLPPPSAALCRRLTRAQHQAVEGATGSGTGGTGSGSGGGSGGTGGGSGGDLLGGLVVGGEDAALLAEFQFGADSASEAVKSGGVEEEEQEEEEEAEEAEEQEHQPGKKAHTSTSGSADGGKSTAGGGGKRRLLSRASAASQSVAGILKDTFLTRVSRALLTADADNAAAAATPPQRPGAPALWSVLGPFRSVGVSGSGWAAHASATAARLYNYVAHHVGALRAAGVLLYADRSLHGALAREPVLQPLFRAGVLRVVRWELGERTPLFYNYDQALVASHALLGLSHCGTNLELLVSDIDEYLYSLSGADWPAMHGCLSRTAAAEPNPTSWAAGYAPNGTAPAAASTAAATAAAAAGQNTGTRRHLLTADPQTQPLPQHGRADGDADAEQPRAAAASAAVANTNMTQQQSMVVGQLQLFRVDVAPSGSGAAIAGVDGWHAGLGRDPAVEAGMWATAATSPRRHPLLAYNRISKDAHKSYNGKVIAVPATRVVAFFVHEGWPLYGRPHMADAKCAFILHIPNYWHARATPEDVAKKYEPFKLRLPYEYYRLGNATSAAMERFWASRGPQPWAALALGGAGARGGALGGRGSKGGGAGMAGVKRLGGKQRGGGGKAIY